MIAMIDSILDILLLLVLGGLAGAGLLCVYIVVSFMRHWP